MLVLHQREPRPSTMLMVQTIGVAPSQRCAPASFLRRNVVSASGAAAVPALATSTAPAAARAAVVPCAADAALQQQAYGCSAEIRAGSKNVLHPASPEDAEAWRRQATGSTTGRKASRQSRGPEESIPSAWAQDLELSAEEPLLGGGAFAKILRVVERSSGKMYAMKVMNRPNFAMRGIEGQIDAEIEAMRRCLKNRWTRHVVRFHDATEDNDHVYIKLELCHCDLLRLANNQPGNRLKENDAMVWTRQLLLGLRDLHCVGILHRDIKPENLLCAFDGTLKIADLGWCADLRDAPSSLAGTFQYMAPEILGHQGVQTEAVDVWSAGVTVMQLVTGRQMLMTYLGPGATGLTMMDPHQATKVKTSRLAAEIYDRCPPTDEQRLAANLSWRCWDLIRRMLMPEVAMRVSAAEALGHSWLQEAPDHDDDSDALASPSAVATAPLDSPMFSAAAPPSQFERATNGAAALAADQGSSSSSFATSHVSAVATAPGSSPAKTYKAVALNAAATITSNLNSVTCQRGTASQSTSTGGGLSSCSSVPALEVPTQARALTPRKMSSATATQSSAAAALGATTPAGSSIIISAATAANVAANVAATAAAAAKAKAKSHSPRRRPNQQLHSSQARLVTPTPHARCRRSETAPTSLQVRDIGLAPTLSPRRMQSDGVDDSSSGPRQVCRSRSARISETWTSTIDSVGIETLDSIGSRVLVHQEPDKRVTSILRVCRSTALAKVNDDKENQQPNVFKVNDDKENVQPILAELKACQQERRQQQQQWIRDQVFSFSSSLEAGTGTSAAVRALQASQDQAIKVQAHAEEHIAAPQVAVAAPAALAAKAANDAIQAWEAAVEGMKTLAKLVAQDSQDERAKLCSTPTVPAAEPSEERAGCRSPGQSTGSQSYPGPLLPGRPDMLSATAPTHFGGNGSRVRAASEHVVVRPKTNTELEGVKGTVTPGKPPQRVFVKVSSTTEGRESVPPTSVTLPPGVTYRRVSGGGGGGCLATSVALRPGAIGGGAMVTTAAGPSRWTFGCAGHRTRSPIKPTTYSRTSAKMAPPPSPWTVSGGLAAACVSPIGKILPPPNRFDAAPVQNLASRFGGQAMGCMAGPPPPAAGSQPVAPAAHAPGETTPVLPAMATSAAAFAMARCSSPEVQRQQVHGLAATSTMKTMQLVPPLPQQLPQTATKPVAVGIVPTAVGAGPVWTTFGACGCGTFCLERSAVSGRATIPQPPSCIGVARSGGVRRCPVTTCSTRP